MTGIKIAVDGTKTEMVDMTLESLRAAVGGDFEIVHLGMKKLLLVNGTGLIDELPVNASAMQIASIHGTLRQPIVGNVVTCDEEDIN